MKVNSSISAVFIGWALVILAAVLAINPALAASVPASSPEFLAGADMSDLPYFESKGMVYKDNGQAGDALKILKNHGINCIRLRLWTSSAVQAQADPWNYNCNLDYTVRLAQRVKNDGFLFLLDFHYSDTWADGGHQVTPDTWTNLSLGQLVLRMRDYNSNCIAAFKAAGVMPDYVQVGNEISSGMLWPLGRVPGTNATAQWSQLGQLMNAAVEGIRDAAGTNMPKIIVHLDRGGDWKSTRWFFDHLRRQNVPFDIIGQSYYPFFQGPWTNVPACLNNAALRYGKPVMIVETDFPYMKTNGYYGIPGTTNGQIRFLKMLAQMVKNVPNHLGAGIFWWGTEYQYPDTNYARYGEKSFFDANGNLLPVASAFGALATTTANSNNSSPSVSNLAATVGLQGSNSAEVTAAAVTTNPRNMLYQRDLCATNDGNHVSAPAN